MKNNTFIFNWTFDEEMNFWLLHVLETLFDARKTVTWCEQLLDEQWHLDKCAISEALDGIYMARKKGKGLYIPTKSEKLGFVNREFET